MSTEFQSKKLSYFFHILDLNRNGSIQLDDFSELAEHVRKIMNYEEGSKEHKRITDKATRFFHALVRDISPANRQEIKEEEWISFFENVVIADEDSLDEYKELIFTFMFDFFDQNRDGFISRKEYADFYQIFGIDEQYLDKAFHKLDNTNSYKLSRYDLMSAVEEFFAATDEKLPGNWVFGFWESSPHNASV